jgi:hypothetical protein
LDASGSVSRNPFNQLSHIIVPTNISQFPSLSAREWGYLIGQLMSLRHGCALNENRDDPDALLEGGGDFDPYEILRVIQPPPALAGAVQPLLPDDREQNLAGANSLFNGFNKVTAGLNAFEVNENNLRAEMCFQVIG